MQTNSPTMGGLVPPRRWCGVEHPHESHIWAQPSGMTGFYVNCPGSTGAAAVAPDTADGRCQVLLQCHRETGHAGGHEAREENTG
jgi:hypothetical protein